MACAPICGPSGTSPCCGSLPVPGGTYYRSYDMSPDMTFNDMTNPATVSAFELDTYEVTVARFRQFVEAGMGTQQNPPATGAGARTLNGMANTGGWDSTWTANLAPTVIALRTALACNAQFQTWTDAPGANEALPINCITWFDAFAFCVWDGGHLPTEAEWNFAAAGGNEQRVYPWSNPASSLTIDCSYANYENGGAFCVQGVSPVGTYSPKGDGKWGHADLGGNVEEWALDWLVTPYINPCTDCANLTPGGMYRAIRGGDFAGYEFNVRAAAQPSVYVPATRDAGAGVRCAR